MKKAKNFKENLSTISRFYKLILLNFFNKKNKNLLSKNHFKSKKKSEILIFFQKRKTRESLS